MSHWSTLARPFVLNRIKKVPETHLEGNRNWIHRRDRWRRPWRCCLHRNLVGDKEATKTYANLAAQLAEGDRGQELRTLFGVDTVQPPGGKLRVKNNCCPHKVHLGNDGLKIPDTDDTKLEDRLLIGGLEDTAELHQRWISSPAWRNAAKRNSVTQVAHRQPFKTWRWLKVFKYQGCAIYSASPFHYTPIITVVAVLDLLSFYLFFSQTGFFFSLYSYF